MRGSIRTVRNEEREDWRTRPWTEGRRVGLKEGSMREQIKKERDSVKGLRGNEKRDEYKNR